MMFAKSISRRVIFCNCSTDEFLASFDRSRRENNFREKGILWIMIFFEISGIYTSLP